MRKKLWLITSEFDMIALQHEPYRQRDEGKETDTATKLMRL
jgi:hypothetical protein